MKEKENKGFIPIYEEYPYNLLRAARGKTCLELPRSLTMDVQAGLQYALFTLTEDAKALIDLRFVQGKSREETAAAMGLTPKQAESLESNTMRKLRLPSRWGCIQYGLAQYIKQKTDSAYNKGFYHGYQAGYDRGAEDTRNGITPPGPSGSGMELPLSCLNLPARVVHSLMRANCSTIGDVARLEEERILRMRNIGRKSTREIANALKERGIAYTDWDVFLLEE